MQHGKPTNFSSSLKAFWRPFAALVLAAAVGSTLTAAAGGQTSTRDVGLDVVQIARQQVGDTYAWGGNGPDAWDCSGLTSRLWREVGGVATIPRVSRDQQAWAVPIPQEQLLPGDLVFFGNPVTHVGIWTGDGTMVDASSAKNGVRERAPFRASVIRYGRVPRTDMPAVQPWTPPSASPTASPNPAASPSPSSTGPAATSSPTASPSASPQQVKAANASPTASPTAQRALVKPAAPAPRWVPLRGLPSPDLAPANAVADRAATNAKSVAGSTTWTDLELVRVAWSHSGGRSLPSTRAAIEQIGVPVALNRARRGDIVVYGKPGTHLAIYLGHGYMVDASASLGRVLVRRVFNSATVHLVRLPVR